MPADPQVDPAPPAHHHHRLSARHIFNLCALVIGVGAFALLLRTVGPAEMLGMLQRAGAWFPLGVALSLLATCSDAAALHAFMRPEARMVSYWRVLAAQMSGMGVNLLTPGGKLGEATKVTLLVGHAPRDRVVSSVLLFNLAYLYVAVVVITIGIPVAEIVLPLPRSLEIALWIGTAVAIGGGVGLAVLVHRGILGSVVAAAGKLRILGPARRDRVLAQLESIDRHLRELHADQSPGTRLGMALVVGSRMLSWTQTYVTLRAAGAHPGPLVMFMLVSAGTVIDEISAAVPLGLGVADGSNYALYGVLGLGPMIGLGVTQVKRMQQALVAGLGIGVLFAMNTAEQIGLARRRAQLKSHLAAARIS